MNAEALNFVAAGHALDMIEDTHFGRADKDAMIRSLATDGPAIKEEAPVGMCLIYPGMTSFVPVVITHEMTDPGYVIVRPVDEHETIKVAASRLVTPDVAAQRTHVQHIERDGYGVEEITVRVV